MGTADLKLAARSLAFAVVGTSGQRCTSTRRVIAQKPVQERLVEHMVSAFGQIKVGDPREEDAIVGPLIDIHAVRHFETAIREAVELGGRIANCRVGCVEGLHAPAKRLH